MDEEKDSSNDIKQYTLCWRNVMLVFLFTVLSAFQDRIGMGAVLDKYMYSISNDKNTAVGILESISGIVAVVVAVPVGKLVDHMQKTRSKLMRVCALMNVAVALLGALAFKLDHMPLLCCFLVAKGISDEILFSGAVSIFADSVPEGCRTARFTQREVLGLAGSCFGDVCTTLIFWWTGGTWDVFTMRAILIFGALLMPVSSFWLSFLADPPAAQVETGDDTTGPIGSTLETTARWLCLTPKHVPWIVTLSDVITAIGAGMSVKFLGLFFINRVAFSGTEMGILSAVYMLSIAAFVMFLERVAKVLGRAQSVLIFWSLSTAGFALFGQVTGRIPLVVIHLVRGGLANSVSPITESILMDFTKSSERGWWNSVNSLTASTWSGSAFVGGLLSDKYGYEASFMLTAAVYVVGILPIIPLLWLVPRKEGEKRCDVGIVIGADDKADADNLILEAIPT